MAGLTRNGWQLSPKFPTIAQVAAKAAIETPEAYGKAVIAEYQKRRDVAYEAISSIPRIVTCKPMGLSI